VVLAIRHDRCHSLLSYCAVHQPYLLEIAVDTIAAALAAERGGADRLELCSQLAVGGLTPSADVMRTAREQISLPIFVMIRPRGGDFFYSDAEFAAMQGDIAIASQLGMNGVVSGVLLADGHVDVARSRQLVECSHPLPVTFHRAFDESGDLRQALEDIIETRATRILTSGGAPTAPQGLAALAELVAAAGDRVLIVPGSGINPSNIQRVARQSRAREYHSGLSSVVRGADRHENDFEALVRELADGLAACVARGD
jgi:copper homeostasis protein